MAVPFGFSVGDFVTVGTLAWRVYKSCKDAPDSFGSISQEVASLHVVIKEAEEVLFAQPLKPDRQESIRIVTEGCSRVLHDLQTLVDRYAGLNTLDGRFRDRVGFAKRDVPELRARLTSNIGMINVLINTSQPKVQKRLEKLVADEDPNARDGSTVSVKTIESLTLGEKVAWRDVRAVLESVGITLAAFEANREFIITWITDAVEFFGAYGPEIPPVPESPPHCHVSDVSHHVQRQSLTVASESAVSNSRVASWTKQIARPPLGNSQLVARLSGAPSSLDHHNMSDSGEEGSRRSPPTMPKQRPPRRLRAFYNIMTRTKARALDAAEKGDDYDYMFQLLDKELFGDSKTINRIAQTLIRDPRESSQTALVRLLKPQNSGETSYRDHLHLDEALLDAIGVDSLTKVKLLVDHGANVNYTKFKLCMPLVEAVRKSDQVLDFLLAAGMRSVGALHALGTVHDETLACRRADMFLSRGLDIDDVQPWPIEASRWYTKYSYFTPLMRALRGRNKALAKYLIQHDADMTIDLGERFVDIEMRNAIHAAIRSGDWEMLEVLYDGGLRTGWLQAGAELEDLHKEWMILGLKRYVSPGGEEQDEIRDGYEVLIERVKAGDWSPS